MRTLETIPPVSRQRATAIHRAHLARTPHPTKEGTHPFARYQLHNLAKSLGVRVPTLARAEELEMFLWPDSDRPLALSLTYDHYQGWNASLVSC